MKCAKWLMALGIVFVFAFSFYTGGFAQQSGEKLPDVIKIGAASSMSGQYAKGGGQNTNESYLVWEKDVNARGGLLGKPVKLIMYDDKSDPTTGAKLYERLINVDKVDLLLGPYGTPVNFAVSTTTEKYKFPVVSSYGAAESLHQRGYKYLFQAVPGAKGWFEGMIWMGEELGMKTLATLNVDAAGMRSAAAFARELGQKKGMKVVFNEEYHAGVTDFSSILTRIKQLNPDIFLAAAYVPEAILLTKQMKELDVNPRMTAPGVIAIDDYPKTVGKDGDYMYGASVWETNLNTPGTKEFTQKFRAMWNKEPDYVNGVAWASVQVMEAAVKKAGSLDREKIREALATLEIDTVSLGNYKVDQTGLQIGFRSFEIQWQNGKREIVWPKEIATAKPMIAPPWSKR